MGEGYNGGSAVVSLLISWKAGLAAGLEQTHHILSVEDAEGIVPTRPPGCSGSL